MSSNTFFFLVYSIQCDWLGILPGMVCELLSPGHSQLEAEEGLSMDFLYYNVLGFLCYSIFNLFFFFSTVIQEQYKQRHHTSGNLVRANDVMFAVHAFIISVVTLYQTCIYKKESIQRVSSVAVGLIAVAVAGTLVAVVAVEMGHALWIDVLYYLSFVKLSISFIKYLPQAWINYQRKSTVGWSIHTILLDYTGGALSISQLLLDAFLSGDWSGVSGWTRICSHGL
ncbi:PQ loop repeat-domain-containing protein [Spinellus fusiger]|nr:PQ loop repeat-domain-containing protein [Spinellus fusiger]